MNRYLFSSVLLLTISVCHAQGRYAEVRARMALKASEYFNPNEFSFNSFEVNIIMENEENYEDRRDGIYPIITLVKDSKGSPIGGFICLVPPDAKSFVDYRYEFFTEPDDLKLLITSADVFIGMGVSWNKTLGDNMARTSTYYHRDGIRLDFIPNFEGENELYISFEGVSKRLRPYLIRKAKTAVNNWWYNN